MAPDMVIYHVQTKEGSKNEPSNTNWLLSVQLVRVELNPYINMYTESHYKTDIHQNILKIIIISCSYLEESDIILKMNNNVCRLSNMLYLPLLTFFLCQAKASKDRICKRLPKTPNDY